MKPTLREFIAHLQKLERQGAGDDRIVFTGCYAAMEELKSLENVRRMRDDKDSYIRIDTEINTG